MVSAVINGCVKQVEVPGSQPALTVIPTHGSRSFDKNILDMVCNVSCFFATNWCLVVLDPRCNQLFPETAVVDIF